MRIEAIAIRKQRGAAMQELDAVAVDQEHGLEQDAGRKPGKFMVTLMSKEAWADACREVDTDLPWTTRRANVLVSDYRFSEQDVDKLITIGDCTLRITRETDPCDLMEQACAGLKQALKPEWRGGVRASVERGGQIKVGDTASIV